MNLFTGALHLKTIERITAGGESDCEERSIVLHLSTDDINFPATVDTAYLIMDQAYTMSISAERNCVVIKGSKPAGVFYGAVSLISLAHGNYFFSFASANLEVTRLRQYSIFTKFING